MSEEKGGGKVCVLSFPVTYWELGVNKPLLFFFPNGISFIYVPYDADNDRKENNYMFSVGSTKLVF